MVGRDRDAALPECFHCLLRVPRKAVSVFGHEACTNFPILVDPYNSESLATAMVLSVMPLGAALAASETNVEA